MTTNFTGSANVIIRGDGSVGGLNIPATTCTVYTSTLTTPAIKFTSAFPNQVDFLDPLTIVWKYTGVGGTAFYNAGNSANPVYITLANPITTNLFHTVMHLACFNSHATDTDGAAANTWALFAGRSVTAWNGITPLTYYGAAVPNAHTTAALVRDHDGDCDAFANLLYDSFLVNGVTGLHRAHIRPATGYDGGLAVKNITFADPPAYPTTPPYVYNYTNLDVSPTGIPGQNMNPPSEKRFNYHRIVHRGSGTEYYDPSYGITTTGATDYAPNIDAWKSSYQRWRKADDPSLLPTFVDDE